jgi:hypothetical protein
VNSKVVTRRQLEGRTLTGNNVHFSELLVQVHCYNNSQSRAKGYSLPRYREDASPKRILQPATGRKMHIS